MGPDPKAVARLAQLLRQVKAGQRFTITNRGEAIADLVPCETARLLDTAAAIAKFRAYLQDNPAKTRGPVDIKTLIREGRE